MSQLRSMFVCLTLGLALASAVALFRSVDVRADVGCFMTLRYYNNSRVVSGPLSAECGWPHTPPYSNFGVESPVCTRIDGYQFAGWLALDGWRQWNACTTQYNSPWHFNPWGSGTQESALGSQLYGAWYGGGVPGYLCTEIWSDQVFTIQGHYMQVWDLDDNWPDENLGTLSYPTMNIAVTCDPYWETCSGETGWTSPSSGPGTLTGQVNVTLSTELGGI